MYQKTISALYSNLYIGFLLLITGISYAQLYGNGWVNWDDSIYILNNPIITSLSANNIAQMFTTLQVGGSYNPLVLLSWAINYAISGLNPVAFHFTNLVFHGINIILVFQFIKVLFKNKLLGFIVATLFALHPFNVEAVAWATSRKELLFAFFLLLALLNYIKYLRVGKKYYVYALVFGVLALLSKPTAIMLPFLLLLIDYLERKSINLLTLKEKLPYFILSVVFILVTINAQAEGGGLERREFLNVFDVLSTSSYSLLLYVIKAIVPFNLSAIHPYPNLSGMANPWYFYLAIPIVPVLLFLIYKKFHTNRLVIFGTLFFIALLLPVLQIIPFGEAFYAERFTYLPYIGLFIIFGFLFLKVYDSEYKLVAITSFILLVSFFTVSTFNQVGAWKNSETLWTDALKIYPDSYRAYINRSAYYLDNKNIEKALYDVNEAIKNNPKASMAYYNKGLISEIKNNEQDAVGLYTEAIKVDSTNNSAYLNRGIIFAKNGFLDNALSDFNRTISLVPDNYPAYYNKGLIFKSKNDCESAIGEFTKAIEREKNFASIFINRGNCYLKERFYILAIKDFDTALRLGSKSDQVYFDRGLSFLNLSEFKMAIADFTAHLKLRKNHTQAYLNRGLAYKLNGDTKRAEEDFRLALQLSPDFKMAQIELEKLLNNTAGSN